MKLLRKNWWKVILIVSICVVVHTILLALAASIGPENTAFLNKPSIFVKKGLKVPAIIIFTWLTYGILAMLFIYVQDKLPNKKWVKGFLFGFSLGMLYFVAMFEGTLLWDDPIIKSILMGFTDCGSTLLMEILLAIFVGTDGAVSEKKQNLLSILVITISFVIGRYFSYSILHTDSAYNSKPLETLIWTFCQGGAVGIMYFNLQSAIKRNGNSLVSQALFFGVVILGLNWLMFHFYIPIIAEVSFADIFTRVGIDILFTIFGMILWEKLSKTKALSS